MTWVRNQRGLCEYCYHDDDLHDFNADQRVPKKTESGYVCSDCADCAIKEVRHG
jgi:superfamily II helicase